MSALSPSAQTAINLSVSQRAYAHVRWLLVGVLSGLILFLSTFLLMRQGPIYQSPDETSNHIFTETFGTTGDVWYENDLLALDEENLLHARGVLTHDGRAVPFNFLGLPVVYGMVYSVVGEHIKYIAVVLAIATAFFLYRAAKELFGARIEDTLTALIACTPLLYYFNRPYMNALPAITCFSLGVWMIARYSRSGQLRDFAFAAAAFAGAMLFRYEYLLFCSLLLAVVAYQRSSGLHDKSAWRDLAVAAGIIAALFIVPVMILNQYVYGSWRTYGYGLFNDVYYPEPATSGEGGISRVVGGLSSILMPSNIDLRVTGVNLVRFTLFQTPMLGIAGVAGALLVAQTRTPRMRTVVMFGALVAFFLCYRGSADTWAATGFAPHFDSSIPRYWLPLYVGLILLAAYAFSTISDAILKSALMLTVAAVSTYTLMWGFDGNLTGIHTALRNEEAYSRDVLIPLTEEDAVIYTGRSDKRVVPYRFAAAWWNGTEFYNPADVARSMSRVAAAGRPVYIRREREVDINELNVHLARFQLRAARTTDGALFRIETLAPN